MKASPVRTHLSQGANDPIMRENLLSLSLPPSRSLPSEREIRSPTPLQQRAGMALTQIDSGPPRRCELPSWGVGRAQERRGGKEWSSRGAPDH